MNTRHMDIITPIKTVKISTTRTTNMAKIREIYMTDKVTTPTIIKTRADNKEISRFPIK